MRNLPIFFATLILSGISLHTVYAADIGQCDSSLKPTLDYGTNAKEAHTSYMYHNAVYEYERLSKMSSEDRGLDIGYKQFKLQYDDAKNAQDFSEKVRNKVVKESSNKSVKEIGTFYKTVLTDYQLRAWESCVKTVSSDEGHVLLSASPRSGSDPIVVTLTWHSREGKRDALLRLSAENALIDYPGYINKKQNGTKKMSERDKFSFTLLPNKADRPIVVMANVSERNGTDSIILRTNTTTSVVEKKIPVAVKYSAYTIEGDNRKSRSYTCKDGKIIDLSSNNKCMKTTGASDSLKRSHALGPYTWFCEWTHFQETHVALGIEAYCIEPPTPAAHQNVEHIRIPYTTGPDATDNRLQKTLTCPESKVIIPGSGTCLLTADDQGQITQDAKQGENQWACTYKDKIPGGVGMWAEADCGLEKGK